MDLLRPDEIEAMTADLRASAAEDAMRFDGDA